VNSNAGKRRGRTRIKELAKEQHSEWLKSHSEKMWADTRQRNAAIEKKLREKDDRDVGVNGGAGRGGSFGRLVVYVVLVTIALAVYRQFHHPDQQGPAKTASTAAPGLALAS
jgi:hypothetical protein